MASVNLLIDKKGKLGFCLQGLSLHKQKKKRRLKADHAFKWCFSSRYCAHCFK
jgi:hypothetical protein